MEVFTQDQLRSLISAGRKPAISLYMPTDHQGRDTRQNPIELKNLLRIAEERLGSTMRPTEARDLLEPARLLLEDQEFWNQNSPGLAVFIAPEFFKVFRLPMEVEQQCVVNDRFDVKPLLPLMESRRFYVLAVSDHQVRLLECTRQTCQVVPLPEDVETTFEGAVRGGLDSTPGTVRHQGGGMAGAQGASGAFHGQAEEIQREIQEDHLFYYRQIDEGVRKVIRDDKDCVILATTDSVAPLYRQASHLKNIHAEFLHGNPEHVSGEQLHQQGCQLMEPRWRKDLTDLQDQFGTAIHHDLASGNIREILPAASMGRVGILFVSTGSALWGKIGENMEIMDGAPDQPGVEDLIDRAAVETILTQGQVVVVKPEEMPGNGELAAIYRY
jgi:hypothetical protein